MNQSRKLIANPLRNSLETEKVVFENFMVSRCSFIETDVKVEEFECETSNENFQIIFHFNAIIKISFVALEMSYFRSCVLAVPFSNE